MVFYIGRPIIMVFYLERPRIMVFYIGRSIIMVFYIGRPTIKHHDYRAPYKTPARVMQLLGALAPRAARLPPDGVRVVLGNVHLSAKWARGLRPVVFLGIFIESVVF